MTAADLVAYSVGGGSPLGELLSFVCVAIGCLLVVYGYLTLAGPR
jgi:hypothetical protein